MNLQFVILAAACALPHGVWAADAPVHECRWTDEAIKLDGTADEPAWREARVIDDFRLPWHPKDKKATLAETKARLLWDREYLYVFADLDDADLQSHVTEHDGKIWNDDVLELLVPALSRWHIAVRPMPRSDRPCSETRDSEKTGRPNYPWRVRRPTKPPL